MNQKQKRYKEINTLLRQLNKDNGYFSVICEGLDIDHNSSLTEILVAIDLKDKEIAEHDNYVKHMTDDINQLHKQIAELKANSVPKSEIKEMIENMKTLYGNSVRYGIKEDSDYYHNAWKFLEQLLQVK